jgi:hypothetical protein
MSPWGPRGLALLVLSLAFSTGCGGDGAGDAEQTAAAPIQEVTIETTDHAYTGPSRIEAGLVRFRMANAGPELHHVTIVRIPASGSLEELVASTSDHGMMPPGYEALGGPNAVNPGSESVNDLELEAGSYALICLIPSPDGVPHFRKGMVTALEVVEGEGATAAEVEGWDRTLTLAEYAFSWDTPPTAGPQRIRVENVGVEGHEVVIARLAEGKTPQDLLAWIESPEGPPPGDAVGGVGFMSTDRWNVMDLDLEPGHYALFCFVPAPDGAPHFVHGMIQEFDIAD